MLKKIKSIIVEYVDVEIEQITPEARFIEDLHFNSYDFMSFLGELEETLDITVDEEEIINLHTVGEAISYIESLQNK